MKCTKCGKEILDGENYMINTFDGVSCGDCMTKGMFITKEEWDKLPPGKTVVHDRRTHARMTNITLPTEVDDETATNYPEGHTEVMPVDEYIEKMKAEVDDADNAE